MNKIIQFFFYTQEFYIILINNIHFFVLKTHYKFFNDRPLS